MVQRHANETVNLARPKISLIMMIILLIHVGFPTVSANDGLDAMTLCSDVTFGLGGNCDDRSNADDQTNSPAWVEGMYFFNMTSATTMQFEASWAIREWDKGALGDFFSEEPVKSALELDNIGINDGLPADVLRSSFDNKTDPNDVNSKTIQEALLEEIDNSVSSLLSSWGSATVPTTDWTDEIILPDNFGGSTTVECSIDVNDNTDGNAFEPPICIKTSVTISIPVSKFGITGVPAQNLDDAYEGLLVMGAKIDSDFSVQAEAGFKGTYAIQPPSYATLEEVSGTYAGRVEHSDATPIYHSGLWVVDNLGATSSSDSINGNLGMTMAYRETDFTKIVNIDSSARSIDLDVVLDMTDENAASIEVIAGIYQIQRKTINDWGIELLDSSIADIPVITSDGIRMAYHTGLLDLDSLANSMPISGVADALASSNSALSISMGSFQWTSVALPPLIGGGLNYTHTSPCLVTKNYCTEGAIAMDDSYPVYLRSTSHTFPFKLAELLGGNLGENAGFLDGVSGDDLRDLLNSGVEISTMLDVESFLGDMLPSGLEADLGFEIKLPSGYSTKDGQSSMILEYKMSGAHVGDISLTGSENFEWDHALCSDNVEVCNDLSEDVFCTSTMQSCINTFLDLDITDFSIDELSKGISVEFELNLSMDIHRIKVPETMFSSIGDGSTNITLEVLPSDLLRLILDISGRSETPLTQSFDLPGCESKNYCLQTLTFSPDGLESFVSSFGTDITSLIRDQASNLGSGTDCSACGNIDFSGFSIETTLLGLDDIDDSVVSDEQGISLNIKIPRVKVVTGLDNSWGELLSIVQGKEGVEPKLKLITSSIVNPFVVPVFNAMNSLTYAISTSVLSLDGLSLPPSEAVPLTMNTTLNEELGISIAGKLKLTLPVGMELRNLSSSLDLVESTFDSESQRQTIVYKILPGQLEDELSFSVFIGMNVIFKELLPFFVIIILLFLWRFRARSIKRKRKRRKQELEQIERAAETAGRVFVPTVPNVEVVKVAENGIVIKKRLEE